jgi:hypothetical protein
MADDHFILFSNKNCIIFLDVTLLTLYYVVGRLSIYIVLFWTMYDLMMIYVKIILKFINVI